MEEDKKEKGFVIKDRRLFSETGEVKNETKDEARPAEEKKAGGDAKEEYFPPIDFSNFVISLSSSALFHFGDFPDPVSGKSERNLPAAKQTIDILGMLQEKTKGNLDENEKRLIDGILFELRMRFVKEKEKG